MTVDRTRIPHKRVGDFITAAEFNAIARSLRNMQPNSAIPYVEPDLTLGYQEERYKETIFAYTDEDVVESVPVVLYEYQTGDESIRYTISPGVHYTGRSVGGSSIGWGNRVVARTLGKGFSGGYVECEIIGNEPVLLYADPQFQPIVGSLAGISMRSYAENGIGPGGLGPGSDFVVISEGIQSTHLYWCVKSGVQGIFVGRSASSISHGTVENPGVGFINIWAYHEADVHPGEVGTAEEIDQPQFRVAVIGSCDIREDSAVLCIPSAGYGMIGIPIGLGYQPRRNGKWHLSAAGHADSGSMDIVLEVGVGGGSVITISVGDDPSTLEGQLNSLAAGATGVSNMFTVTGGLGGDEFMTITQNADPSEDGVGVELISLQQKQRSEINIWLDSGSFVDPDGRAIPPVFSQSVTHRPEHTFK